MPLQLTKRGRESWRDCVARISGEQQLQAECLAQFDKIMGRGTTPEENAAWDALYDWDCLDYVMEDK